MNITVCGKKIIHKYHHYIMRLQLKDFISNNVEGYSFRSITSRDFDLLKEGDFSVENMKRYLKKNNSFASGFICVDDKSKKNVGYIWVIRRGGDEMTYRVRNVDAMISCVCVFKAYRGKNIVNVMIKKIVDVLKSENLEEVVLGVRIDNIPAIKAYKKAGFRNIGEKKFYRVFRKNFPYHVI